MGKELAMNNDDVCDADRVCDECSGTVSPNDSFCPHCGERL